MFVGPHLMTSKIIHVSELILRWISKIIPYKFFLQQTLQQTNKSNNISLKEKQTKNSEQVHANLERKVYKINFSKPSLHFLLGKLEFIIKHKKMQTRKKENKMQEPSNFQNKVSYKFLDANWLVKMLIMNSDQNL
jgi:hypothetical protein